MEKLLQPLASYHEFVALLADQASQGFRMSTSNRLLHLAYWTGAILDGAMVPAMLSPQLGAKLFGLRDFHPGVEYRYAMFVAASLMTGWTALLLWADRKPF